MTAGAALKFVCTPLKPDRSHGHPAPNQCSRKQTRSSSELDPNVSGLSVLYLYAVYIYNMPDDLDASKKRESKENVGAIFFGYSKETRSLLGLSRRSDVEACVHSEFLYQAAFCS